LPAKSWLLINGTGPLEVLREAVGVQVERIALSGRSGIKVWHGDLPEAWKGLRYFGWSPHLKYAAMGDAGAIVDYWRGLTIAG
jgi:hypothetical protein